MLCNKEKLASRIDCIIHPHDVSVTLAEFALVIAGFDCGHIDDLSIKVA